MKGSMSTDLGIITIDPEAVRHYETTLEVLGELGAGTSP